MNTGQFPDKRLPNPRNYPLDEESFLQRLYKSLEGTPNAMTRPPQMGYQELDIYTLYYEIMAVGGFEAVCNTILVASA